MPHTPVQKMGECAPPSRDGVLLSFLKGSNVPILLLSVIEIILSVLKGMEHLKSFQFYGIAGWQNTSGVLVSHLCYHDIDG